MAKATTSQQPCFFPPLVSQFGQQSARPEMPELRKSVTVPLKGLDAQLLTCWLHSENVDLLSLLRTAWAVVLRAYTSGNHICFGLVDFEEEKGPASDWPDLREHIKVYESTITSLTSIQRLLHHGEHSNALESYGFITADDSLPAHSWPFNSIVYIDCNNLRKGAGSMCISLTSMCREGLNEFQIIVRLCRDESTGLLSSVIDYTTTVLSHEQALAVAETLNQTISEIVQHTDQTVATLDICTESDIKRMVQWNQAPLSMPRLEQCAFQLISRRCVEQPDATAVSAWDGELTYWELHQRSSTLAAQLAGLGVGSGVFVPLFFEKSKWAVVALLGVIKAGGAFILMDISYPLKRIRAICQSVSAKVAVVSPKQQLLAREIVPLVVAFGDGCAEGPHLSASANLPPPQGCSPESPLYVVFTSGSTGDPKGVIINNVSFCSLYETVSRTFSFNPSTRLLQFASHAFTLCSREMLLILIAGGCLCIPSEGDRVNDLAGFMCRHRVSFAILTPSVAGTLSPSSVPSLQRLVLGGEAVKPAHIATWAGKVHLMTGYAASEIAGTAIVGSNVQQDSDPRNVGFACGAGLWVVDADNPEQLAPVGAVGELILQSHGLAGGYLNGNTLVNQPFFHDAQWQKRLPSEARTTRLYRTGDMFRYNIDGSLHYVGRKDNQVKVNGQRIELGDIESHIATSCATVHSSVVLLLQPDQQATRSFLIAFICPTKAARWGATSDSPLAIVETPSSQFYLDIEEIIHELQRSLPSYMIPSIFVPLLSIPLTLTGKENRRLLLETVATWPEDRFATYRCRSQASSMDKAPATERDDQIRHLVANTLKKEAEAISMGSSFLALGGDSISAMRLVALAKQEGLCLTVGDIFNYPILSDLATVVRKGTREQPQPKQYSFKGLNAYGGLLRRLPAEIANNIHEIIPATAYQRMTLTELRPRYLRIALPSNVNRDRLLSSCQQLLDRHTVLRTIFETDGETNASQGEVVQVILRPYKLRFIEHHDIDDLDKHCLNETLMSPSPTGGGLQFQAQLLTMRDSRLFLVLRFIHAQYDGISLPVISEDISAAYNGLVPSPTAPFSKHVEAVWASRNDEGLEAWRTMLRGSEMTILKPKQMATKNVEKAIHDARAVKVIKRIPVVSPPENITMASLVKAAWALTFAKFVSVRDTTTSFAEAPLKDIVFGQVVHGRGLGVAHESRILGPCVNTVPVRVNLSRYTSNHDLLSHVQQQHLAMMPFENIGLDAIIRNCTDWTPGTKFGSVLRFQNFDANLSCVFDGVTYDASVYHLPNRPSEKIHVIIMPSADGMQVIMNGYDHVVGQNEAEDLVDCFCTAIHDLARTPTE
ncbi:putative nonribosomal peptide synthase [Aspergillus nomiae NRRL 13137]|uniref:Putative nonribosomal peptide synthase n=1 Tax=Aspergillus nomiae NRRL (strain ATCC 15546 / NRRL 13137 / CBS 260.88 / M93) TaxID=1509407 RepID=A0A0L1JFK7_ASPN3|nr:putative nonribosomal peptide synthase [Aspergillus nomiae NRRL 13137]KNG90521.1 putative nonribosomal peptide synthase [Aspergillus nomiae NRRL 13137]